MISKFISLYWRNFLGLTLPIAFLPLAAYALQLTGGVEHTDALPQLSPQLGVGQKANQQALEAQVQLDISKLKPLQPMMDNSYPLQGQAQQSGPLQGQAQMYQPGQTQKGQMDNANPLQGRAQQGGPLQGQAIQNNPGQMMAMQPTAEQQFLRAATDSTRLRQSLGNRWVMIPNWMAGVWHRDRQYNITVKDYDNKFIPAGAGSYVSDSLMTWGQQIDPNGNIWHYMDMECSIPSSYGQRIDFIHNLVIADARLVNGNLEFIRQFNIRSKLTSKGDVAATQRQEELQWVWPLNMKTLQVVCSTQVYRPDGRPGMLHTSGWYLTRVKDFRPTDNYKGKNLKEDFRIFLSANGMYQGMR